MCIQDSFTHITGSVAYLLLCKVTVGHVFYVYVGGDWEVGYSFVRTLRIRRSLYCLHMPVGSSLMFCFSLMCVVDFSSLFIRNHVP